MKIEVMPNLAELLRVCAKTPRDAFSPFWEDEARRLMRWAADTIDAAEAAIHPSIGPTQPKEVA